MVEARKVSIHEWLDGKVVIVVPHMDDCVLACGGLMALFPNKEELSIIYATDGTRSPVPALSWFGKPDVALNEIRIEEARSALSFLGVSRDNIYFLDLPDGNLRRHRLELSNILLSLLNRIEPAYVFFPFRYDRHPDHIAINHVIVENSQDKFLEYNLIEYFVYYRWKLLPLGDIRRYIRRDLLIQVDIDRVASKKRQALDFFQSQTTRYFPWQSRPNLTNQILDEVSQQPELFLAYDPSTRGAKVFTHHSTWIKIAHTIEPFIKVNKDLVIEIFRQRLLTNA